MTRTLKDLVRKIVPEGDYLIKITSVEEGTSKAGNAKVAFNGTILTGPEKGKTLVWSRSLMDNALWKLAGDLINLGVTIALAEDPSGDAGTLSAAATSLEGAVVNSRVTVVPGKDGNFNDVELLSAQAKEFVGAPTFKAGPKPVSANDL